MVTTHTLPTDLSLQAAIKELFHGTWNWKNSAAAFGLCAGFIAPIVGSIVTVISWFKDPLWHRVYLHQAGTTLFVVTLPLLILGAHCLDLIDNERKAAPAVSGEKGDSDDLARD